MWTVITATMNPEGRCYRGEDERRWCRQSTHSSVSHFWGIIYSGSVSACKVKKEETPWGEESFLCGRLSGGGCGGWTHSHGGLPEAGLLVMGGAGPGVCGLPQAHPAHHPGESTTLLKPQQNQVTSWRPQRPRTHSPGTGPLSLLKPDKKGRRV